MALANPTPSTSRLIRAFVGVGLLAVICAAVLFGAYANARDLWPFPTLRAVKAFILGGDAQRAVIQPGITYDHDPYSRLASFPGKTAIPCPPITSRTAVFLITGQSNAANFAGQRYRSAHGERVVNFFAGKCTIAGSPLLGSSHVFGEYWTSLANRLISAGAYDQVILVPAAIGGTRVERWAYGGNLNPMVMGVIEELRRAQYPVTHVFWHQGESDWAEGTSATAYRDRFHSFVDTLRKGGVEAKVHVVISTKCLIIARDVPDNPIAKTLQGIADPKRGIEIGINTDSLLDQADRFDDCHLSGSGVEKIVAAWTDYLLAKR